MGKKMGVQKWSDAALKQLDVLLVLDAKRNDSIMKLIKSAVWDVALENQRLRKRIEELENRK